MTAASYQPIIFPKYWQTDNVKPLMTNIGLPFAVRWPKHDLKREHFHLVVVHWRQRKVYEEVCCTCKVVVLLILDCFQTFSLLSWYLKFPSYAVKQRWLILPPLCFWNEVLLWCFAIPVDLPGVKGLCLLCSTVFSPVAIDTGIHSICKLIDRQWLTW